MSMINLMPPQHKQAILYGRRNSLLIRWMVGILLATVGVAIVAGGSLFYLRQDTRSYNESIAATKADLAAQDEEATLKRVEEMSNNLKLVVEVLSNEIQFSRLLQQIGLVMPSGTILQDLSLSNTLDGGITLMVGAVSYEAGTQAQVNLGDPANGIFERADLISLTCVPAEEAESAYPCQASIRALFVSDNPFLLLGNEGAAQ